MNIIYNNDLPNHINFSKQMNKQLPFKTLESKNTGSDLDIYTAEHTLPGYVQSVQIDQLYRPDHRD